MGPKQSFLVSLKCVFSVSEVTAFWSRVLLLVRVQEHLPDLVPKRGGRARECLRSDIV